MIDGMYRIYMFVRHKKLYVVDIPKWELVEECTNKCEEEASPYMVMQYSEPDGWLHIGIDMDKDTVRDAIGRVPLEYTDQFIRRENHESSTDQ